MLLRLLFQVKEKTIGRLDPVKRRIFGSVIYVRLQVANKPRRFLVIAVDAPEHRRPDAKNRKAGHDVPRFVDRYTGRILAAAPRGAAVNVAMRYGSGDA